MKERTLFQFWIFAFNIIAILGNGLTVLDPSELAGDYLSGPVRTYTEQFNVTAVISCFPSNDICGEKYVKENADKLQDTLVLIRMDTGCFSVPSEVIKKLRPLNVAGIILQDQQAVGYSENLETHPPKDQVNVIPIVSIQRVDSEKLQSACESGKTILATIDRPDRNPWIELVNGPAGVIPQVLLILILAATIAIAIYKLVRFVRYSGWELSVTQVCLGLDLTASAIRILFIIDPLGYYGIWTIEQSAVIFSISCPFSLTSVLLIGFYWSNIVSNFGSYSRASAWLREKKRPFFISVASIFALMLLCCFIDIAVPGQGSDSVGLLVVLAIVSLIVAIFFIINGCMVLRILNKASMKTKRQKVLQAITAIVASLGVLLLLVVIALGLLTSAIGNTNMGRLMLNFNLWLWSFLCSLAIVVAFQPPEETKTPSNTSGNTTLGLSSSLQLSTSGETVGEHSAEL